MHVLHTADVPPNHGRMILAMIGCNSKRRNADSAIVSEYSSMGPPQFQ